MDGREEGRGAASTHQHAAVGSIRAKRSQQSSGTRCSGSLWGLLLNPTANPLQLRGEGELLGWGGELRWQLEMISITPVVVNDLLWVAVA